MPLRDINMKKIQTLLIYFQILPWTREPESRDECNNEVQFKENLLVRHERGF